MRRIVQLVHGFPPERLGGTERYAAAVAAGLRARGVEVYTIAATLSPGEPMYRVRREGAVFRVVHNAPYAGVRRAERDPALSRVLAELLGELAPDLVHIQHLQFLGVDLPYSGPLVWTLHDAWAWCAAGGTLLRQDQPETPVCPGPGTACAVCTSAWVADNPALAWALRGAGPLGAAVGGERLHQLWKRVPARLRTGLLRGAPPPVNPAMIRRRDSAIRQFASRCHLISPSRWLADAAVAAGLPRPTLLPHGVAPGGPRIGGGPLMFLGTLAPHKGPDLVWAAWRRAGVGVPLHIHGPVGRDPAWAARFPHSGPLAHADVGPALARAHALVLGSRWPENAPLVILEARAAGCPVVAPAIGGIPELVEHGVDGFLYRAGDEGACADAIKRIVEDPPVPRPPLSLDAHLDRLQSLYSGALRS